MFQQENDVAVSTSKACVDSPPAATRPLPPAAKSRPTKNEGRGCDYDDDDDDASSDAFLNHHHNLQPTVTYTGMTLKERRELYGSVYDTDEALWADIQKYVVDVAILPTDHQPKAQRGVKRPLRPSLVEEQQTSTVAATSATTATSESQKDCNTTSNSGEEMLLSQSSSSQKSDAAGQSCSPGTTTTTAASNTAAAPATKVVSLTGVAANATTTTTSTTAATVATANPATSTIMTRHPSTDIWGRFPPKEPKDMISCPSCSRPINTLRLASHLDKCMLGKTRG
jgi:Sgf11 (transcriptional regulation protein)